jgi:hypothetical protein
MPKSALNLAFPHIVLDFTFEYAKSFLSLGVLPFRSSAIRGP